ncbi:UPF0496 protein 1-like [Cornus florida]|uniref:UPF0496 protein 1-like n=1 Tax=Cornus florida TaxID=4283 RepID=UPI00289820B3|nr:UPF0496 protein 1-like [Cornus florida]
MGLQCSKTSQSSAHTPTQMNPNSQVTPDLSSYEAACWQDPDLRTFDSSLQQRTSRVINTLAVGVEVRSLSMDSLRELTECFLETNQEVVRLILECKRDIWKNKDLFDLVEDYFENSLLTLDFCTALERCLKRARDSQLMIQVALQQFEEEQRQGSDGEATKTTKTHSRTLKELKNFKTAGDPFNDEFFSLFQSVYAKQVSMFVKLQASKSKLDKKLKSVKAWRTVSNVIFMATFASVLICSVVAAAIAAPPVVTALAAAAAVPLGSMGKWINSLWKKYENELKGERDVMGSLHIGTYVAIKDLDSIRLLVDRLEIEFESLLQNADFALREDEAVMLAIDEIKKKLSGFMQTIQDLSEHTDKCGRDIRRARTLILQRIIKHPST